MAHSPINKFKRNIIEFYMKQEYISIQMKKKKQE